MKFVLYRSVADKNLTQVEFNWIVEAANSFNSENGITGLILFVQGRFFQWIEGDDAVVNQLYTRIAVDPRHRYVQLLTERPSHVRYFEKWGMLSSWILEKDAPGILCASDGELIQKFIHYSQMAGEGF